MNQQHVGHDFFQARLETDVPKRMVPTVVYTARKCPVCLKWARELVRPPQNELQCEICVDFCEGDKKYPKSYTSFRGSWIKDGNAVIETLKGAQGEIGPVGLQGPSGQDGKDAVPPTRQELIDVVKQVLREQGFWRLLFRRIK